MAVKYRIFNSENMRRPELGIDGEKLKKKMKETVDFLRLNTYEFTGFTNVNNLLNG
jgi:hypothetical protein